ncbi:putative tail tubular protein A [Escherichia phage ECBP5]|uniref:Putative tail tubular protein A n=1 Tax=Escherichia phage ECBP5 TaxID=1498172 RepID=A0A0F6N6D6_9CAUD|nr:putative tail tubular protein A [Escherichia phage ECBP5]AID17694.1 putative tail tubular protein A [Escherichia phage ECBP5]
MQLYVNTRLDAINYVLSCIGLAPVDSEDDYNLDVAQAGGMVDKVSRTIQNNKGRGYWFNREANHKLAPDPVTGNVLIPNNTLAVYRFDNFNRPAKIATRGRALYDTATHGFDMRGLANSDGFMHLMLVTQIDYGDLPQTAKDAIASQAGMMFARSNEMDVNRIKVLAGEAEEAMWGLECEETTQSQANAFKDSRSMAQFNFVVGGYNDI